MVEGREDRRYVWSSGRQAGKTSMMKAMSGEIPQPWERPQQWEEALAWVHDANRQVDEIYRRHGGTQTPPSKRPPSKLHPLVQLDEAIGRDLTRGDETA